MPLPPHGSLLKFIAVLISCHGNGLSFMTVQISAFLWETLQHSCLSPDNSLEVLFTEVLNCVNSAGHPVIYFTGSVRVFSPYSPGGERY